MWDKDYKDYPKDKVVKGQKVEPGRGIIGCEMHEINGWGNTLHLPKKKKKGFLGSLIQTLFGDHS